MTQLSVTMLSFLSTPHENFLQLKATILFVLSRIEGGTIMNNFKLRLNYVSQVTLVLLVGILAIALTACGGDSQEKNNQGNQQSSQAQNESEQKQPEATKNETATKDPLVGKWNAFALEYAGFMTTFEEIDDPAVSEMEACNIVINDDSRFVLFLGEGNEYEGTVERQNDEIYLNSPASGENKPELIYNETEDTLALDTPYGDIVMKRA